MPVRVNPLPASALRIGVVVDAGSGAQLLGAQNAVADLMIGLPSGAEAAVVGARPARLVQPLTGDAGSVVQALADATFSGPGDDASALKLAVREVLRGARGAARRGPHHDQPDPRRAGERGVRAAPCRSCQPVRRGCAGNRAVARPARQRKRRLGGYRIIRPLALARRRCDRCRPCPPVPARVHHGRSGADRDPSSGGGGRSGDRRQPPKRPCGCRPTTRPLHQRKRPRAAAAMPACLWPG